MTKAAEAKALAAVPAEVKPSEGAAAEVEKIISESEKAARTEKPEDKRRPPRRQPPQQREPPKPPRQTRRGRTGKGT